MIEAIPLEQCCLHVYTLHSGSSQDTLNVTAMAAYVQTHYERLLDEAHDDWEHGLQLASESH
jgi:hypothetical protein